MSAVSTASLCLDLV
jgi:hypothetical protein